MESAGENQVAGGMERSETSELVTTSDALRPQPVTKTPSETDYICRRSLTVFGDSPDLEEDDAGRKKLISDALQQEDEFLEYLMSLPAAREQEREEEATAAAAARKPIFARSASAHSDRTSPKVGLDHLDNLCKLMEQLGELREQNWKLQRRVRYLEDMKSLQEMHRRLQSETRLARRPARPRDDGGNLTDSCLLDGSDESLLRGRFSGGKVKTRQGQAPSHMHRGRSRSVGVEDGKDEAEEEDDEDGGGGSGSRTKRRDKSRQRRSLAAGDVGGGGKAKVSKWTKVKEAFRWERAAASVLPEVRSADVAAEDARYLRVPPPGTGDHSSPADSVLSGRSSSACSSAGGQSPGSRLGDFALPPLGALSSSSSSDDLDLDLTFSDIMREIGPQRSASVADSRASARDARRHSLSQLAEEEDASRRSKSLDGDASIIASHFSNKEALVKLCHAGGGGKSHKTPWGKVKDIIQTRKDSLKRRHRGKAAADHDHEHEEDPYAAAADMDPPSSPGDAREDALLDALQQQQQQQAARPARQSVCVGPGAEVGRRQHCKVSTCSLGSHPLALEPPPASRRLTPTLTITLPSTEELRTATAAAGAAPAPPPDASPQPEERGHRASTACVPGRAEDAPSASAVATSSSGSESNRRQAAGNSPPTATRAASKWTKVKKAFLTSAPGRRDDGSDPASPHRHSSFSYDLDADELSSGEYTEAAAEGFDAANNPSPPPLQPRPPRPRLALQAEVQRNYEQLQQKLSLEFHRKLSEWERMKTAAAAAASTTPDDEGCGSGGVGAHHRDKSFRRKLEEWERLRGRGKDDDGRPGCRRILLHEDNLSADFRKKLQEWQRIKEKKQVRAGGGEEAAAGAAGWDSGTEEGGGGARTPSPGVSRKNSGGGGSGSSGKCKRAGGGSKSPDKVGSTRKKDLQWLEKELHKIDREKQRLERERGKFLEREARLEKMRTAMGSRPRKQEVLIQTSTGFFRFQGISEKFTRRLYEWEEARGIGPEASTFALLDPGYKPRLPGQQGGGVEAADGGPLARSKSASSVTNMAAGSGISHQPSSLSLNDVGVLEHVEAAVVAAALEDARASSEPHLRSPDGGSPQLQDADGPRAVIVDVEDVVEETAAPLLVAREVQGHTPVYCYAPAEVTRLIDSSGSESDKDSARMVQRTESTRTQCSYKLIEENMHLLDELRLKEDICRQIESEMGNIEAKIDHMTKTQEEEIERLKKEEDYMHLQGEESATDDNLLGQLRDRILDLEIRQERLLKEGASLQESFAEQSHRQAAIAQSIVGNARQLRAASGGGDHQQAVAAEQLPAGDEAAAVATVQELSSGLLALAEKLELSLARRSRNMRSLRLKRDGKSRPSTQRFRASQRWYSEDGISLSTGSLHSVNSEDLSLEPSQAGEDISHLPALLTHKILELKQALSQLCVHSDAVTAAKSREVSAGANPSEEDESTATFVVKVGKKKSVSQPVVRVDADGNMSPVSVTITPAFWKRKLKKESPVCEDSSPERSDKVSPSMDDELNPKNKRCSMGTAYHETGTDSQDEETAKSYTLTDNPANNAACERISDCEPVNKAGEDYVQSNASATGMSSSVSKNNSCYETQINLKDATARSGRQKRLLKTRRVSDTYMGYNRQSEGKAKVRRQKECEESGEEEVTDESVSEENKEEDNETKTKIRGSQNVTSIVHDRVFEESSLSENNWPTRLEGPIVSSRTTFLVNEGGERTTSASPVNVFVPTTRKIFSPIRRDSKGKTSTVISYVVAESPSEVPSPLPQEAFKNSNREEEKRANGVPPPASRILRESRSHSSSPLLARRLFDKKEQTYRSKEELTERGKELENIINATNSEPSPLTNGTASESETNTTDESRKTVEERSSPSKAFPPLSPGPAKRELNRSVSKETAPSIRLMIARYNQKLTEQEGPGGRSPDVSHSGSGSPVAWRSPATERRVRMQTEKYQEEVRKVLEQGGRKEVQKSASAGVIRSPEKKEEPTRSHATGDPGAKKPPTAVVQPRGILKSSSAGTIKPVSPLTAYQPHPLEPRIYEDRSVLPPPEQFKDEMNLQQIASPGPSSPSSPELEEPLRLRYLRLQRAKEEFLSRGPGGRSWPGDSDGGGGSGGARSRLSQISVGSESSFEGSSAAQDEDDPLLVKSASAGMISVEPAAYRRLSSEGKASSSSSPGGSTKSRFGLSSIASRFRKVKMRKAKGRDAPGKLNTVSMLCRQSLLVDLHVGQRPPPSSKSCPSSPVLQRSSSRPRVDDDEVKPSSNWLRRPAKIFKPKQ